MIKVKRGPNKISVLKVLEHTLHFAEDGIAEAEHLTDKEIERCRSFFMTIIGEREKPKTEVKAETKTETKTEGNKVAESSDAGTNVSEDTGQSPSGLSITKKKRDS